MSEIIDIRSDFIKIWEEKILGDIFFHNIPGFSMKKIKKNMHLLSTETKLNKLIELLGKDDFIPNEHDTNIAKLTISGTEDEVLEELLKSIEIKIKSFQHLADSYLENHFKMTKIAKDEIYFLIEAPYTLLYGDVSFLGSSLLELERKKINLELLEKTKKLYMENISFLLNYGQIIKQIISLEETTNIFYMPNNFLLDKIQYPLEILNQKDLNTEISNIVNNALINQYDLINKILEKSSMLEETKNYELLKCYSLINDYNYSFLNLSLAKDYLLKKLPEEMQIYLIEKEPLYLIDEKLEQAEDGFIKQTIIFPHILFNKKMSSSNAINDKESFKKENARHNIFNSTSSYSYIKNIEIDYHFKKEINFDTLETTIKYEYFIKEEFQQVAKNKFIENFLNLSQDKFELKKIKNNENKEFLLREINIYGQFSKKEELVHKKKKI